MNVSLLPLSQDAHMTGRRTPRACACLLCHGGGECGVYVHACVLCVRVCVCVYVCVFSARACRRVSTVHTPHDAECMPSCLQKLRGRRRGAGNISERRNYGGSGGRERDRERSSGLSRRGNMTIRQSCHNSQANGQKWASFVFASGAAAGTTAR